MNIRFVIAALALAVSLPAVASAETLTTRTEVQRNAPVAITRCALTIDGNVDTLNANLFNRTTHGLLSADLRINLYDTEGTPIGTGTIEVSFNEQVTPGDTMSISQDAYFNSSEPVSAWGSATCRLIKASFTGRKSWSYGQSWREHLSPVTRGTANAADASPENAAPPRRERHSSLSFNVTRTWNDHVQGNLLVHAALVIQGGSIPTTVAPSGFLLRMTLANGGQKTYRGLSQPAPRYEKINPFPGNPPTVAYEVDPKDDLGALGSISVPPHGTAMVIVTFVVPDPVADQNANTTITHV